MAEKIVNSESAEKDSANRHEPRLSAKGRESKRLPLVVCEVRNGSPQAIYITSDGTQHDISDPDNRGKYKNRFNFKVPCVMIVPRSQHLMRIMTLPSASSDEIRSMIRLEVEAVLPLNFGPVEIGYRRLGPPHGANQRLEVYIVKRDYIETCEQQLRNLNIRPTFILPSASIWRAVSAIVPDPGELFYIGEAGACEVVFATPDEGTFVRHLDDNSQESLWRGLADTIRAFAEEMNGPSAPIRIDWVGTPPPSEQFNGSIQFRDQTARLCGLPNSADAPGRIGASLCVTAQVLSKIDSLSELTDANLLPAAWSAAKDRDLVIRLTALGTLGLIGAMLVVLFAMNVSAARYHREVNRLDEQISRIASEGEAVSRKLQQLQVVADAHSTRHVFSSVIMGLHDASPANGLSYSQIDLDPDGRLQLRGQADSLALPFELPQMLERQPMFEAVSLLDAGQAKKGIGSITEFRISAKFRGEAP